MHVNLAVLYSLEKEKEIVPYSLVREKESDMGRTDQQFVREKESDMERTDQQSLSKTEKPGSDMERTDQQEKGIPQQQHTPAFGTISMGIGNSNPAARDKECIVREQDQFMPIANVIRLMRKSIRSHGKISDDAKELVQESVSEFVSFVTSEANFRCQKEQRKTITAEDVLWAMSSLGFDDYIEPLTFYLDRLRESDGGERSALRGEPLMRRSVELGATGITPTFPPGYYMGPHNALLGAMTTRGFANDVQNAGPSGARVNSLDQ